LAWLSRSIVPPVTYSTLTPVSTVNFFAIDSSIKSRKLPPQVLTTSFSSAEAADGPPPMMSTDDSTIMKCFRTRFISNPHNNV
jgi:hypothetical protein